MSRDIDALIAGLSVDEKATLTAGRDNWATAPVERVGIPAVRVTDGPNGARGSARCSPRSRSPRAAGSCSPPR